MNCDYCKSKNLSKAYRAETTKRDLNILICDDCDLIQSWPRLSGIYKQATSISGGADWGYIRYGKLQGLDRSIKFIKENLDLKNFSSFFDIGANRGSFVKYIKKNYPLKKVQGVENDVKIYNEELRDLKDIKIINDKFENIVFNEKFDFIHSSHTLEHLVSAFEGMKKMKEILSEDGYVYLEVPNVDEVLNNKENITEFFIDNHLFHFSQETLEAYIEKFDFEIFAKEILPTYLCYIIKHKTSPVKNKNDLPKEKKSKIKIEIYQKRLKDSKNDFLFFRENLKQITKTGPTAVWGMGRIFDVLWKNNGFKDIDIDFYIDKNLALFMEELNDKYIQIYTPQKLATSNTKNLIVCSDIFFEEIKNEANKLKNNLSITQYKKLFRK